MNASWQASKTKDMNYLVEIHTATRWSKFWSGEAKSPRRALINADLQPQCRRKITVNRNYRVGYHGQLLEARIKPKRGW